MKAVSVTNGQTETANNTEGGKKVLPPQQMTENIGTAGTTETVKNTVPSVITRYHSLLGVQRTPTEWETEENARVFEHRDKNTGSTIKMGEGEIKRRVRIYGKRVLEHEKEFFELQERGETPEMISKKQAALENNIKQKHYWETALESVTVGNTYKNDETALETSVSLLKAA